MEEDQNPTEITKVVSNLSLQKSETGLILTNHSIKGSEMNFKTTPIRNQNQFEFKYNKARLETNRERTLSR